MSFPDKLIVSGATKPVECNGEYLPYAFENGVPTYRNENFVVSPVIVGGVVTKWLLNYFVQPGNMYGTGESICFSSTNLTGEYKTQTAQIVYVYGCPVVPPSGSGQWYSPLTIDINGAYIKTGFYSGKDRYTNNVNSKYDMVYNYFISNKWVIRYGLTVNPTEGTLYRKSNGGQSSPLVDTWGWINQLPIPGIRPAIFVGPDFFFSGTLTVEGVFNPVVSPESPDLLPPNATPQERALSKTVARAGEVPMQVKQVWNPQTCPVGILPWLAWALSVDDWSADWTEQQKRDAIAASVAVHRVKGTVGAIRRALQAIGYEVIVNENTGTPYTFRLQVDLGESGGSEALYNEAERLALLSKNARSHLLGVDGLGQVRGTSRLQSVGIDGNNTRVWPDLVEEIESTYAQRMLSAEHTIDNTRVRPEVLNTYSTYGDIAGGGAITYDLTVTL